MDKIRDGVAVFQRQVFPKRRALFERLAKSQQPIALFITCADSRIVPSLITHTGPGELFVERNPGNIVPIYSEESVGVSASIEYAIEALNVPDVIVCGHSDCGAVKAILHPEKMQNIPAVGRWLLFGSGARRWVQERYGSRPESEQVMHLTHRNVIEQMDHLRTHPSVATRLERGEIAIHGWVYSIESGTVESYNPQTGEFSPWPEASPSFGI